MRILVIRNSAMGDVALLTPVIRSFLGKYPGVDITLMTRRSFSHFFDSMTRLKFFFPDFKGRHKGFTGILRLFRDVRKEGGYDAIFDLHDVPRTWVLRSLFRIAGTKVCVIDKGRKEKKALTRSLEKKQLRHTVDRYMDVFSRAGFSIENTSGPWIIPAKDSEEEAVRITRFTTGLNIGVAPFARHKLKVWPAESMISLLKLISAGSEPHFWFFGGKNERERLDVFQKEFPGSVNLAGRLDPGQELAIISKLDFMISMDSANMHMAALCGTRVVSVWGATDPLMGFSAWMQPDEFSVRIPVSELTCRPCTVFGKGECLRGDHACMEWLTPGQVYEKIKILLFLQTKTHKL